MRIIDYTVEVDLNTYLFLVENLYDDSTLRFSFVLLGRRLEIFFVFSVTLSCSMIWVRLSYSCLFDFSAEIIHAFLNVFLCFHRLLEKTLVPCVSGVGILTSIDDVLMVINLIDNRLQLLVFPLVSGLDFFELPFEPWFVNNESLQLFHNASLLWDIDISIFRQFFNLAVKVKDIVK